MSGIPKSFMTFVNKDEPGARPTPSGHYVMPKIDKYNVQLLSTLYYISTHTLPWCVLFCIFRNAYANPKKEKPPFVPEENPKPLPSQEKPKIPGELVCPVCKDLLRDAVVISCCGSSFCDECKSIAQNYST